MSDRLLTASEVAERLNVPESWVRAETRAGRAVVDWLEQQRAGQWRKHKPQVPS